MVPEKDKGDCLPPTSIAPSNLSHQDMELDLEKEIEKSPRNETVDRGSDGIKEYLNHS